TAARLAIEAGVIGERRNAGLAQGGSDILDLGAREAIDDTGLARMPLGDKTLQLVERVLLVDDLVADVRPVEARHEAWRIRELQPLGDLLARRLVGGRGERNPRHLGKAFGEHGETDILGAEIMAPLRNAM